MKRTLFEEDNYYKSMDKWEEQRQEGATNFESLVVVQVLDEGIGQSDGGGIDTRGL